jgi:hypothetical protein
VVQSAHRDQTRWIDDTGDSVHDETTDGREAAWRGFAFAGPLAGQEGPPYVVQGLGPDATEQGQGVIQAKVRDDEMGIYRVVIHAEDEDGMEARLLTIEVRTR